MVHQASSITGHPMLIPINNQLQHWIYGVHIIHHSANAAGPPLRHSATNIITLHLAILAERRAYASPHHLFGLLNGSVPTGVIS